MFYYGTRGMAIGGFVAVGAGCIIAGSVSGGVGCSLGAQRLSTAFGAYGGLIGGVYGFFNGSNKGI
jgi:hypothetical protein